ncbi:MAG TPA: winged helix-turn-helix domain-containing protein [Candidatus Acidoferrales bacterium]|nr:winged helix-turn-helix domain-containing protein [Candidatus Acidoferrales bacterium]
MEPLKAVAGNFLCFGAFEVDFRTSELRRNGLRLKLEPKPFEALGLLVSRPGELIDREQFYRILWPGTHVRFDRSLNTVINRVREVLGDSAGNPRFVETLSRRGYRFIAPVRGAGNTSEVPIDSIAVLPFSLDDGGKDNNRAEFLLEEMTEGLIHALSQLSGLRVQAGSTVARFKGQSADPGVAAQELGVRAVLTGRASCLGKRLAIIVELVDAADGARLWGQSYQSRSKDIGRVAEPIAREVAKSLGRQPGGGDSTRVASHSSVNSEAYREYLHGRFFYNKMTRETLEKAMASFERAAGLDPGFALAWAAQADCLILRAFFGLASPLACLPQAKQAALRALSLDERLAEAHASLAAVLKAYDWDWPEAEREYRRALALDPNGALTHRGYSAYLAALGRTTEAMREIERAWALDPLSLVLANEAAWNLYMAGQYARAEEHSLRTLALEPGFAPALYTAGLAREQIGRLPEAIAAFREARRISQENPATIAALGHAQGLAGTRAEAEQALGRLRQLAAKTYVPAYWPAIVHAGLGESAAALDALERAYQEHDVWLVWIKVEPRFQFLQSNPAFRNLLARAGLA